MNPFVQSPCQRCGATVWIPTATGMAYCPQCQTPAQLQPGAQSAAPAQPAQPAIAATMAIPSMATPPGGPSAWGAPPAAVSAQGGPPGGAQPFSAFQPPPPTPAGDPFGAPQQGGFGGAPQQGGFGGAPQQGGFGAPQQGGFGAPQQGGFGAPASPYGAAPSAPGGYGAPGGFPQAGYPMPAPASRGGMLKILLPAIGVIALACIASLASLGAKNFARPGHRSLSAYSIDEHAADPDAMIRAAGELARNWRSDAVFSSININGLTTAGTVDLGNSSHTVTIEYFSPARASSYLESERRDAIKKFTFTSSGIEYATMWGVRRRVERPTPTPLPTCGTRQLGAFLTQQGVPATADLHVQYDPQFSFAVNGALAWHVTATAPVFDRWFDVGACTFLRGN